MLSIRTGEGFIKVKIKIGAGERVFFTGWNF
jgi:hypothetical protein